MFLVILLGYMPRIRTIRKKGIDIFKALETYQIALPKMWHQSLFLAAVSERDSFYAFSPILCICLFKNLSYFERHKKILLLYFVFLLPVVLTSFSGIYY